MVKHKIMMHGAIYSFIFKIFGFIFLLLRIVSKIKGPNLVVLSKIKNNL